MPKHSTTRAVLPCIPRKFSHSFPVLSCKSPKCNPTYTFGRKTVHLKKLPNVKAQEMSQTREKSRCSLMNALVVAVLTMNFRPITCLYAKQTTMHINATLSPDAKILISMLISYGRSGRISAYLLHQSVVNQKIIFCCYENYFHTECLDVSWY